MTVIPIHKGSFFEFTFCSGAFVFEIEPNLVVNEEMYQEFLDALKQIYISIGRPFPTISKVSGLFSMTNEARSLAKQHTDTGVIYACASLAPDTSLSAMMKFILVVIGSKKLPRAYFTSEHEVFQWIEQTSKDLGKDLVTEEEVVEAFHII